MLFYPMLSIQFPLIRSHWAYTFNRMISKYRVMKGTYLIALIEKSVYVIVTDQVLGPIWVSYNFSTILVANHSMNMTRRQYNAYHEIN